MKMSVKFKWLHQFYIKMWLDHLVTDVEIFIALQETLRKLWKLEVLKICQKLDAKMEGFY